MSFIAKNPLMLPKISNKPDTPAKDTDGLFTTENGWYRIDDNGNTYKIVTDNNYVHTDNNYTNEDKHAIDELDSIARAALDNSGTAIRIAVGANSAKTFLDYKEMIDFFNINPNWGFVNDVTIEYVVGQNILIGTVNVPDLWIASEANGGEYAMYNYTDDETFVKDLTDALEAGSFLRVGFITLGALETQKVDLTDYPTIEEMNAAIDNAMEDIETPSIDLSSYPTTEEMDEAISDAINENNGSYIEISGDVTPIANNVYIVVGDTVVRLPNASENVEEYYFSLDTSADSDGNVVPSITFEGVIKWAMPFEIKSDTHYEIAIRGNCGVIAEFNEVMQ